MIKFLDLHKQKNRIASRIDGAIKRVLNHGQFILGKEVLELEKKLKEFSNAKHCITCANGTDALVLALRALEIKENEIVFAPSFTYVSTVEAIKLINAKVCFVDVESDTYNICPSKLEDSINYIKKLGLKARAVIAVDLFGQPANYDELKKISRKEKLSLISDAAQSFGAKQKNRKVGELCEITTTSFFPAKPLGCYGDGGAVFTESTLVANKIKSLRSHGQGKDKYDNVRIGMNSRLDSIQVAILIENLKFLITK